MPRRGRQSAAAAFIRRLFRRLRRMTGHTGAVQATVGPLPLERFANILMMPNRQAMALGQFLPEAGPVWPRFEQREDLRFRRDSRVMDRKPRKWSGPVERLDEVLLWGGTITPQFGHLVSETVPRLFASAMARPDLRIALVAPDPSWPEKAPKYLAGVLAWLGIAEDRLVYITKPTRVRALLAMPQPEVLDGPAPPEAYLALYEANARRQGLIVDPRTTVFVTRGSVVGTGRGIITGESYLAQCLAAQGVEILDAGAVPMAQQLGTYAGAKTLIIVEGSAQIGRQLLGRIDQDIHVLQRRPDFHLAEQTLGARCRSLSFIDCIAKFVVPDRKGVPQMHRGIAYLDPDALQAAFLGLGIDLREGWRNAGYDAARRQDTATWWLAYRRLYNEADRAGIATKLFNALVDMAMVKGPVPETSEAAIAALDRMAQEWLVEKDVNDA